MARIVAIGTIRKVRYSFAANPSLSFSKLKNPLFSPQALFFSQKTFSWYNLFIGHNFLPAMHRAKVDSLVSNSIRRFFGHSTSNSVANNMKVYWRRLPLIFSYRESTSLVHSKIACFTSLTLTRFYVVPRLLLFITGEIVLSGETWADGDYFTTRNALYRLAEGSRFHLSYFRFALLEFFILILRAVYLAVLFFPAIIMAPFADTLGNRLRKKWLHIVRLTLEKAGPAFIKWGQWAATRPDLFAGDLCAELAKLHTRAPAHSFAYTRESIEKAFNQKLSDIFERFEEEPLASGSIAQVYRATLRIQFPGKKVKYVVVAVKVRHPGVSELIRRDFVLINVVTKISQCIPALRSLRLDESVQQFAVFMMSQVDLSREAAHLSRFNYNFRNRRDASFPKPIYPFVHPAVLVETYEHGKNISYYVDELEGNQRLKSALAHIGTCAFLKMLLVDNFIHADMHPGNILVRMSRSRHPSKGLFKPRPHLVFLDVGLIAELSSSDRINLLEFFKAVALRDGRTAAICTLRFSKRQKCPNPDNFIEEVEESFKFWVSPEGGAFHPAQCMQHLLAQVRRHRVNIDGNVCTVIVTMLVLEGWQRKLDPDYEVMKTLQALLLRSDWAKSLQSTIEGLMGP
ncbi:probable serine/threonine-protein kinase abkC isoform X1 [Ananas comosus]|uniref:Probable serine/threonine-protein kinase abkC isoform X1 n=2 Tax=Ananas comosus TaxID=4615 RepID=A0A6P5HMS9_ANACO|nr:probable serine/threonine-protein kinase abkC isoform X1 [Ananas comosus]